ncbi:hypothetical protein HAX54_043807, partial [Datura stramonium]|nr:hypothetical protein [Datura stramonium]
AAAGSSVIMYTLYWIPERWHHTLDHNVTPHMVDTALSTSMVNSIRPRATSAVKLNKAFTLIRVL